MKLTKSSLSLLLFYIMSFSDSFAQSNVMDTTFQGKPMLCGWVSKSDYLRPQFSNWFSPNYDTFKIAKTKHWQSVSKKINQYDITIYMGTWCGDSRRELPRMIKILEDLGYDMNRLKINALDQLKQAKNRDEMGLNIHRVPTLIVSRNDKEQGRIVESPVETLEDDLEKIVLGKRYRNNYYGLDLLHERISKKGFAYIDESQYQIVKLLTPYIENAYELRKYGLIYLRNNEVEKAIIVSKLNHALFPTSDIPWYSMGKAYSVKNALPDAKKCFKKAIELNPENKYAKAQLDQLDAK